MKHLIQEKLLSPSIDPATGWLIYPDAEGEMWVSTDDVQTAPHLAYSKTFRDACAALRITPVQRKGFRRQRWVTLAEARALVGSSAREPP